MSRYARLGLALALLLLSATAAVWGRASAHDVAGSWQGAFVTPGDTVRVHLVLQEGEDGKVWGNGVLLDREAARPVSISGLRAGAHVGLQVRVDSRSSAGLVLSYEGKSSRRAITGDFFVAAQKTYRLRLDRQ